MNKSYFGMIEDKYSCSISLNKPIIIRLDGKDICKNRSINLYNESFGGFAYAMQLTAKEISKRYNSLVLISSDEMSIIFLNTDFFYEKFNSVKCQKSSSLITQDVSVLFNHYYNSNFTYFDARTFNIVETKLISYIRFRTKSAKNVSVHYFAKRYIPLELRKGKKLIEIEKLLETDYSRFITLNNYHIYGKAYYNDKEVDLIELLKYNELNVSIVEKCYCKTINSSEIINSDNLIDTTLDIDDI